MHFCVCELDIEKIRLQIKRTGATKGRCNHPLCGVSKHLKVIPQEMRYQIAVEEKVFIPRLAVACSNHIEISTWENVNHLIESDDFQFTKEYLEDMYKLLSNPPAKSGASKEYV